MRNLYVCLTIVISFYFLTSCHKSKDATVRSYISYLNSFDTSKIKEVTTKDYHILNNPLHNKSQIDIVDFKFTGGKVKIESLTKSDTLVKTREEWTSLVDSLLRVTPKLSVFASYKFDGDKISVIQIDSVKNKNEYKIDQTRKFVDFLQFIKYKYPTITPEERVRDMIKILLEYNSLSDDLKREYISRSYVQNKTFYSNNNMFGMRIEFKGKSTVYITVAGMTVGTSYTVDENNINIKPVDGSYPMPITIVDESTLVGKSLTGNYIFKKRNE